jgi:hypothetical protein
MRIGASVRRVWKAPGSPDTKTPRSRHEGMNRCTGSSSATCPSSTSIMKAMLVIGLVIE